jgi:hypothetical protein
MSELHPISLAIQAPSNGSTVVAAGTATTVAVTLRGSIVATTFPNPAALTRTWYSSLQSELGRADVVNASLAAGSHIVTYTVKDKNDSGVPPAQLAALYQSVEHIGTAGGPPNPPPASGPPCVIHVFAANMVAPAPTTTTLSMATPMLEAQAPLQWAQFPALTQPDPNYHAVNRLRYRWIFRRVSPAGSPVELNTQGGAALKLLAANGTIPVARLHYTGSLPNTLVVGQAYTVTLRVEDLQNSAVGHEVTRTVTLVA